MAQTGRHMTVCKTGFTGGLRKLVQRRLLRSRARPLADLRSAAPLSGLHPCLRHLGIRRRGGQNQRGAIIPTFVASSF